MAAPTQEYPPWLTPSQIVVTDAAGLVTTQTTIVYLPLTYLGPSIPLGDLYTYGGSTFPPTIVTGFPTTTPSATSESTTSTAIPPTTITTPTTSAIPTSLSESSTTSSSPSDSLPSSVTTIPTTSSTPTTTTPSSSPTETDGGSAGALSRGQLVGVIVASILGLIFLFVFLLALWLWCRGRRLRQPTPTLPGGDSEYDVVDPREADETVFGQGSPRQSGEEHDPFLQPSRSARALQASQMQETTSEMGSRPGVPRVPPPAVPSMSSSTSKETAQSSSTNGSGYGTLLERPTLNILPPMSEEGDYGIGPSTYLTEEQMRQLDDESVLPQDQEGGEYTGAYAIARDPVPSPPRALDPENLFGQHDVPLPPPQVQPPHRPRDSVASHPSLADAEDAALLTARRVKVSESGLPESGPSQTRSGFLDALGLGLTGLGRLSWFSNNSPRASPRHSRHSPTFQAVPLSDNDVEAGRVLLRPGGADSFGRREGIVGVGTDGERPQSHLSTTSVSGATVWHDAQSSLPGTPQLAVPPRAVTPAGPVPVQDWLTGTPPMRNAPSPPAYEDVALPRTHSPALPSDVDPLDLPAPTALTHFASSSSMPDTGTVSSIGLSKNPFPPGLEFMAKHKTWSQDGSMSATSSPAWNTMAHRVNLSEIGEHEAPDVVDMLEDQPPSAQETWRSMASLTGGGFGDLGRRTTFGLPQYTHPGSFIPSEQGSLHSMRSHLNPPSIRSTGSAAASRRELSGSVSSNSSRPSAHSSSRSAGSAANSINSSLVRHGSIINDGRRRYDPHSPPVSAFINRGFQTPPPRAATPGDVGLFKHGEVPTIDGSQPIPSASGAGTLAMPQVHMSPSSDRASTIRTVTSGMTTVPGGRERTLSTMTYGASSSIGEVPEEPLPLVNPALSKEWTSIAP